MAFNGSGTFSRLYSWAVDAAGGVKIRADRMDAEMTGFATGLSTCITKDGQTTVTANLPMATYKHTNVGSASSRTDYARFDQLQDGKANWVDSGGTADAITATYSPAITTLVDGQLCYVRAGAANATTTPTFSPNGLTARVIVKNGGVALVTGDIAGDGHEIILRYDLANTRWELLNAQQNTPDGSITFPKLDTDIIASATDTVITASDIILFGDSSDSNITKRDTVQGILDLVPSSGALVYLGSSTASSSSDLKFEGLFSSLYDTYYFDICGIYPTTDATDLYIQTSTSAGPYTYDTTGYQTLYDTHTGTTVAGFSYSGSAILVGTSLSNNSTIRPMTGLIIFHRLSNSPRFEGNVAYNLSTGARIKHRFEGDRNVAETIMAARVFPSSGTLAGGTIRLYGVKKS